MRIESSLGLLLGLVALGAVACGGSAAPPAAPESAAPAQAPAAPAAETSTKPSEDEGWSGESAAKNGDASSTDAKPTDSKPAAASDATPADSGSGKPPETRTMEVIRQAVMDNRKAARKCYDDARKDLKDLKGDVTIHFVIDPEGKVKSAELNQERSTLKSPAVVNCVIDVIKSIHFPKSSRAMETSTNYPFNFTP